MTSSTPTTRTWQEDRDVLHALIRLAADVELFTIPLYMSSLYSITGRKALTDRTVFPFIGPTESYTYQGADAQQAYNIVFSIYIQEMLHLQLALNVGNILGAKPSLQAPVFPPKPSDPNWIPCLGELANLNPTAYPEFADINVHLGPLDQNALNLFLAIELPDEDSIVEPPTIPLTCAPEDVAGLTFGGIGKLYHIIQTYFSYTYADQPGKTLFELCYAEALTNAQANQPTKQIPQVNAFVGNQKYSHLKLSVDQGASPSDALSQVNDMINAIVSEGEGSSKTNNNFVSPNYRPDVDDLPVDGLWGAFSHWARFQRVNEILPNVQTWPQWRAEAGTNPWKWQDLVADPLAVTQAEQDLAAQRATAWNDPEIAGQLNEILDATFGRFLATLTTFWDGTAKEGTGFPYAAMNAISSRVTAVWAAGGVPQFDPSAAPQPSGQQLHSCQGLNVAEENGYAPGQSTCSTAIQHTCAGTNSCATQGGCGYAIVNSGPPNNYAVQGSPKNYIPAENTCANLGGCGAPIPVAQIFTEQYGPDKYGDLNGKPVWDHARELFFEKNPDVKKTDLKPSDIRLILPPS